MTKKIVTFILKCLWYALLSWVATGFYALDISLHSISNQHECILYVHMKALCHWMLSNSRVVRNRITIWTPTTMTTTVPIRPWCRSTQREIAPRHPPKKITLWAVNSSKAWAPTPHWEFHTVPFSRGSTQQVAGTPQARTPGAEQL